MSFGSGRGYFGSRNAETPAKRLGWRVTFSEETHGDGLREHLLIEALAHPGLAYRLCMPGLVVNPALAEVGSGSTRCLKCERIARAAR